MYYEDVAGNLCICGFFYMILHDNDENWRQLRETNPIDWDFDKDGDISMVQIGEWYDENLQEGWIVTETHCGFYNSVDAVAFKMRWL
ncbi:hypothetical protein LCGC14_0694930 [marine sediment metagenome]|uniref:Uncharacterized protein n=1 Tax=marine sediment metagenome TaxID=412755 RepID=A0A0F9TSF0_9ZZZZ